MRPPSADDNIHANPHAPKQVKAKLKRKALIPSDFKKKRPRKRLAHKPKIIGSRELSLDSLNRLRDEFEEEEDSELVAQVRCDSEMPRVMEVIVEIMVVVPKRVETDLILASEVKKESETGMSRSEDNVPKEFPGVIDISWLPSFTDSMINEAQALKGKLVEGVQGEANPFNNIFDSLDFTASEGVTGLGDLSVPNMVQL